MLNIYRILINLIFIISPIIITFRLLKKKENFRRFKEKFCFFSKQKTKGKLIWIHGASVGEFQSIVPLIERYERKKSIKQILITSNTLSSSKVISKYKFKKVIHQFFPIDTNYHTKKFINYWEPTLSMFVDSEIWPNMLLNLKEKKIPIILLNGRITTKSFKRWNRFKKFSKLIFGKFDLCMSSSLNTKKFLKKLGAKHIKYFGNLKFSESEAIKIEVSKNIKKFIQNKKVWCASSTHPEEENFIGIVHKKLKLKHKNLLTFIIPRHINRIGVIKNQLTKLNLNIHLHEPLKKIDKKTDIYLVNSYGQTKSFFSLCKNVFLGGSLIKHGGQNPLEAARYGCNILHGPHISNFKDIYTFLEKNKITNRFNNSKKMINILDSFFLKKTKSEVIKKKIDNIGKRILYLTFKEINLFIEKNEVKKT